MVRIFFENLDWKHVFYTVVHDVIHWLRGALNLYLGSLRGISFFNWPHVPSTWTKCFSRTNFADYCSIKDVAIKNCKVSIIPSLVWPYLFHFQGSVFNMVHVFNLLPQRLVDMESVKDFQRALTDIARVKCRGSVRNWKAFLSAREKVCTIC